MKSTQLLMSVYTRNYVMKIPLLLPLTSIPCGRALKALPSLLHVGFPPLHVGLPPLHVGVPHLLLVIQVVTWNTKLLMIQL